MFARRGFGFILVAAVVACVAVLIGLLARPASAAIGGMRAPAGPQGCGFGWRVVPSPNAGTGNNYLKSVAVISSSDIWAVGYYVNGSGNQQTLTEHFDGNQWSIVPSPNLGTNNSLTGVSAVASNDVWAVGNYTSPAPLLYTLHWDGTQWTQVANPDPGSNYAENLQSVAAVSHNDVWAVGFYREYSPQSLILHWDGNQWSVAANPPGIVFLNSVTAISSTDVWAVGYLSGGPATSVTFHWNGSSWTSVSVPNIATLYSVSGSASNDVWAVGDNGILHWNGTQWTQVSSPVVGALYGVKSLASDNAWAVNSPIVLWDGSAWNVYANAPGSLTGIDAKTELDVWAVGSYTNGPFQTLVERYSFVPCTSVTPTQSGTSTLTATPTGTRTPTPTGTPTGVPTSTPTNTPTGTPSIGPTNTPVNTPTATPTAYADLTGSVVWSSQCPTQTLSLTTHLTITPGFGIGSTTMRLRDSNGDYQDFPVPPLNYHSYADTYTYACPAGSCFPSSWLSSLPFTLTVDVNNVVAETNENNNDSYQYSPPPTSCMPTALVGHVTWQGPPPQPNALQQLPITVTLKSAANEYDWQGLTTDASGYFTVTTSGLPLDTYNWRVKGPKYLANSGAWNLSQHAEFGPMRVGDANNDNVINTGDFIIVKATFGKGVGDPGYDDRADFNGDQRVNATDFNLFRGNFGLAGAPPLGSGAR